MALANREKRSLAIDVRQREGPRGARSIARLGRRLPHQPAPGRFAATRPRRRDGARSATPDSFSRAVMATACAGRTPIRRAMTRRRSGRAEGLAQILSPPDLDYPIGQRGAMGDRNGAMALAFGYRRGACSSANGPVPARSSTSPCWRPRCGRCRPTSCRRSTAIDPEPAAGRGAMPNPLVGVFRTKDDRHIQLVFLQADRYWRPFCERRRAAGSARTTRGSSTSRSRRANSAACMAALDAEFASRTFEEWKQLLAGLDAPWAPVQSVTELLDDPQVTANGYVAEVEAQRRDVSAAERAGAVRREAGGAASRAGARRAHRTDPDRDRLRLGRHQRAAERRGHPVSGAAATRPVADETSAPFWEAADRAVLAIARCSRCGATRIHRTLSVRTATAPSPISRSPPSAGAGPSGPGP